MKKKLRIIPLIVLIAFLLSGCIWKVPGQYLSDDEFVKEIQKYTGKEKVTILEKKEENQAIRYTVVTDKRNLEFEVMSIPAGTSGLYNPAYIDLYNYLNAVQAQYDEQINLILDKMYAEDTTQIIFADRGELRMLISRIVEIDDIYKSELEYHDAEWLKEFPYTRISILRKASVEDTGDFSCSIAIDGTLNEEELEAYICNLYKERTGKELKDSD